MLVIVVNKNKSQFRMNTYTLNANDISAGNIQYLACNLLLKRDKGRKKSLYAVKDLLPRGSVIGFEKTGPPLALAESFKASWEFREPVGAK